MIDRVARGPVATSLHRLPVVRWLAAWSLFLLAACGEGSTPPAPVASLTLVVPAGAIVEGSSYQLSATANDAAGAPLAGRVITWSSGNPVVATVSASGLLAAVAPGAVTVSVAAEGQSRAVSITVVPIPVSSVVLAAVTPSMLQGTTQLLTATLRDANNRVLADRTVSFTSDAPSVATVSVRGEVTAVTPGTAVLTALSEGVTGTVSLTVREVPVATVVVSPATATLIAFTTQTFSAQPRDSVGGALSGRSVSWTSSAPAVATISSAGLLSALAPGTTTIAASSGGQTGTALVTIVPNSGQPAITSVTPATLLPGLTAVVQGFNFDTLLTNNSVTIGGAPARVTQASATQLIVVVPCVQGGSAEVRVRREGLTSAPVLREMTVTTRTLAVGQSLILANSPQAGCNELTAAGGSARYLLTVFSAATSANTITGFEITGNGGGSTVTALQSGREFVTAPVPASPRTAEEEKLAGYERVHLQHMERDRREYDQLVARMRTMPRGASVRQARAADTVGGARAFFFTFSGGCQDVSRIMGSKAVFVGARSVIWEDTANTLQSSANTALAGFYERLGRIYEQDQHDAVAINFGDPLRRDAVTDNDGKLHMIFSQRLNGSGAAAYVTSCDQAPTTVSAGSNFGQFFYGNVPTVATLNLNSTASPDGWFAFMARTVVHEVKHVASLSARFAKSVPYEQSWLEEGTARMAEEMWIRAALHNVAWKANTGFGSASTNGIFCDFHLTDATCNSADPLRRPGWGMRRQFNEIREKLIAPWNWSPYGDGTGQTGAVFYNSVWSLVRYAIDRYALSDAAFLTALTDSRTNGVTNLTTTAGVSLDQLIGGWGMALYTDDYPGLSQENRDLQIPTWNFRSIYAGLNASPSWSTRFNTPYPVRPEAFVFGRFRSVVPTLRGGAHAYFELSGAANASQAIKLQAVDGGPLSTNVRLAIVRLQ